MLFPGSGLFKNPGRWIVAAEMVETSRLFARQAAVVDVGWLEALGGDLCRVSWSDPHWEKSRGQVVAREQVMLFGLPIVWDRRVNFGRIEPVHDMLRVDRYTVVFDCSFCAATGQREIIRWRRSDCTNTL